MRLTCWFFIILGCSNALAGGPNPWRELDPRVRAGLSSLNMPAWARWGFMEWYARYYCPSARGKDFAALPLPSCPEASGLEAEYRYNHLFSLGDRVSAACVMTKLLSDFPAYPAEPPGLAEVTAAGDSAILEFNLKGATDDDRRDSERILRNYLERHGFVDSNGSSWGHRWGLRSSREGAEFHFEADQATWTKVNLHIDLKNPGLADNPIGVNASGVDHYFHDLRHRRKNYAPEDILATQPNACGVGRSDLELVAAASPPWAARKLRDLAGSRSLTCP